MKLKKIKSILDKINLPIAYFQFPVGHSPELPYVIYFEDDSALINADNTTFKIINKWIVELYCEVKNPTLEEKIEQIFNQNGITISEITETYIKEEHLIQKTYYLEGL